MDNILVIYHNEDNDGVFSGAMFVNYINKTFPQATVNVFGANYHILSEVVDRLEYKEWEDTFDTIIMTDISFNEINIMEELYIFYGDNFIWCDHHKPIIDESRKHNFVNASGVRDTSRSAILCAYKYLYDTFDEQYNAKKINELLRILSAYDSYTWDAAGFKFDYVNAINTAVTSKYNLDFEYVTENFDDIFNSVSDDSLLDLYTFGCKLLKRDEQRFKKMVHEFGDYSWIVNNNRACALFIQESTRSQIFDACPKNIKNGVVFKHTPNSQWIISLYNIHKHDDMHCGEYMKEHYGGGGHRGAAGATISEEQFINILKTKTL